MFQVLCTLDPPRPLELTISPVIFRSCAGSFTNLVYHLLSLSLRSQKIPLEWRTHTVIPVFKSGDKSSVTNYRPISLLCIISIVLEKLVYQQVLNSFTHNCPAISLALSQGVHVYSNWFYTHMNWSQPVAIIVTLMLFILITARLLIQCHIMNCYSNYGSMGSQMTFGNGLRHT